ncbi:MAG: ABC transporter permease [Caldilineaceae bacterium]|nr:ABC transporter permease [Caldilineaceae bacterium]
MGSYILRRIIQVIPTFIGITLITFLVLRLTGDPAAMVLGEMATEDALQEYRARFGLDAPLHIQYLRYMQGVVTGDFGTSLRYNEPVVKLLLERLPATLQLGGSALLFAIALGIPVGIFSALTQNRSLDFSVRALVLLGQAIPGFYLGILLIMLFSVQLGWLPTGGRGNLSHLILPTITLGTALVALIVRFTRSAILDVMRNDYIRTARAKGLRAQTVLFRHALRNAMIPLLTIIGLQMAVVFSGAIVTETVFSWPGMGRLIIQSIYARDFPLVQTAVLFVATTVILINLAIDILYVLADPRVRAD